MICSKFSNKKVLFIHQILAINIHVNNKGNIEKVERGF